MTHRSDSTKGVLIFSPVTFVAFFFGSLILQASVSMGFRSNAVVLAATGYSHRSISTGIRKSHQYNNFGVYKDTKVCQWYSPRSISVRFRSTTKLPLHQPQDQEVQRNVNPHVNLKAGETASPLSNFIPGSNPGFYVVKQYKASPNEFDLDRIRQLVDDDLERLELTPQNISVPIALMLFDKEEFPSKSRARKACRKANIMIHRGPLAIDKDGQEVFNPKKCERARVGDRIYPGDVLAKQVRLGSGEHPVMHHKKPPFELSVVYEDDHFAIVVYAHRQGGHGIMTVRAALPFAIRPSTPGTYSTLRRPQPVHRLDKPTSGLLIVAKTKPAMVDLSHQFRDRKVKKTYTAIINGIPDEPQESSISSLKACGMGVDVDPSSEDRWQLIDHPLDEKSAVTIWRSLKYSRSLKANENYCTLVELKPKTGRYHQLRRHMALVVERPLIGDSTYDGGGDAMQLRKRGLFLTSNKVVLEHPFYNSDKGQEAFNRLNEDQLWKMKGLEKAPDGKIMVSVSIPLPDKFDSFMSREEDRYERLHETVSSS